MEVLHKKTIFNNFAISTGNICAGVNFKKLADPNSGVFL